ncbi:hypothetical protein [Sphingomonas sp. TREG-RG-20F-R18-01]|uniref:hypothetical protein n=1 Tax=Sphingomonas sp. TREG-RG-20F-R18-01 TaxID=2914982 RepID=UPI001F56910B|nr:hypothetical protein [Sphingomonas sp. TREG-RG-20F-R18-01]
MAWIKQRPRMLELENSAEESLTTKLLARVQKLEEDKALQDARIEVERVRHESQMAIMRHRVNNADACLDALLMLLKTSPEKVAEAVIHIERMRERQNQEVALERGAQVGATIAAVSVPIPTP